MWTAVSGLRNAAQLTHANDIKLDGSREGHVPVEGVGPQMKAFLQTAPDEVWEKNRRPIKVADHFHWSGQYRGPACQSCNVKMQEPKTILVFFHNLEGYDGHELLLALAKQRELNARLAGTKRSYDEYEEDEEYEEYKEDDEDDEDDEDEDEDEEDKVTKRRFDIIGSSNEKFMHIRYGNVIYRDSIKTLNSGLGKLMESHAKAYGAKPFPLLRAHHENVKGRTGEDLKNCLALMIKKVPFPYASMTSPDYFKLPALLPIEAYDDDIAEEPCSQERYTQVKNIVEYFGMNTQEEYHDLYLRTDVLALADCMLAHRKELSLIHI